MIDQAEERNSSWITKFKNAIRGVRVGMRGGKTNSFFVHIPAAVSVLLLPIVISLDFREYLILVLCAGAVIVCELFNSSLEKLAQAITREHNEQIRDALDIASGAVFVSSFFSLMVVCLVLVRWALH